MQVKADRAERVFGVRPVDPVLSGLCQLSANAVGYNTNYYDLGSIHTLKNGTGLNDGPAALSLRLTTIQPSQGNRA